MDAITSDAAKPDDPVDAVMPLLGRQVRRRRERLGVTIEQLMGASGLRRWQLYRIEQGYRPIPRDWFLRAATGLDRLETARWGRVVA